MRSIPNSQAPAGPRATARGVGWSSLGRLLAGVTVFACVTICAAAAVALWDPERFLFDRPLGLSRQQLEAVNFLSHAYAVRPELAWVLWWVIAAGIALAAVSSGGIRFAWDMPAPEFRVAGRVSRGTSAPALLLFWIVSAALIALLLAQVYIWVSLARNEYLPIFFPVWLAGIAALSYPFWRLNRAEGVRFEFPFGAGECAFLTAAVAAFTAYCCVDLMSWRYSFMGDELGFWTFAGLLAEGRVFNVFSSSEGVAGYHPVMCSVYQALFLRVFGTNAFAWHLSSVAAAALSLPVFYLFLREWLGVRAAAAGTLLLAGNHYLLAYAHNGLNNVQVLFPALLALSLWLWGARRGDWVALYGAGVATGLGFYTYYSSRLALAFLLLAFFLVPVAVTGRKRLHWLLAYVFAFCLTAMPLVAAPGDFLGWMLEQSAIGSSDTGGAGQVATRVAGALLSEGARAKWEASWIDPFYSPRLGRFMVGSWVDSLTAAFALLGIVWAALRWFRHRILLWLLGCYLGAVLAVAVLSQYAAPPDTRMLFLVPFYIAFAVLALEVLWQECSLRRLLPRRARLVCVGAIVAVALAANQYRHLVVAPQRYHLHPFGLVVKVAQTSPSDRHFYFVAPPQYWVEMVKGLADMYGFGDRLEIMRTDELPARLDEVRRPAAFLFANMFPERMEEEVALVRRRFGNSAEAVVVDGSEMSRLRVVDVPAAARPSGS